MDKFSQRIIVPYWEIMMKTGQDQGLFLKLVCQIN